MSEENNAPVGLDAFDTTAAAEAGAVMEVTNPKTGEVLRWPDGRPWTITYFGADSERVQSAARRQSDRRFAAQMRSRAPIPSATLQADNIELLVIATKTWDIPLGDGTPAKSDANEYRSAYQKYRWLYDQGNEWTGNRANFL